MESHVHVNPHLSPVSDFHTNHKFGMTSLEHTEKKQHISLEPFFETIYPILGGDIPIFVVEIPIVLRFICIFLTFEYCINTVFSIYTQYTKWGIPFIYP